MPVLAQNEANGLCFLIEYTLVAVLYSTENKNKNQGSNWRIHDYFLKMIYSVNDDSAVTNDVMKMQYEAHFVCIDYSHEHPLMWDFHIIGLFGIASTNYEP